MTDLRPIGVFDSGMGGLSVLREIRALLPAEDLLCCADSGNAPYGEKSQELITERSLEICEFLIGQGAKAIVIACNTATAAAAGAIRSRWPAVPVIAMEPAVKPATEATRKGVVGVLATTGTLKSARFAALLDRFGRGIRVLVRPGVGLVEAVERGECDTPRVRDLLARHLDPMLAGGADVIVLGCTHYVFLREQIQAHVGPAAKLIDTGAAVAHQLQRKLQESGLECGIVRAGTERFWASGQAGLTFPVLKLLWPEIRQCEALPESACMMRHKASAS
jgi:glutamate racemase